MFVCAVVCLTANGAVDEFSCSILIANSENIFFISFHVASINSDKNLNTALFNKVGMCISMHDLLVFMCFEI